MVLTVGSKLGLYEIVSLVGAGGMGQVYRAKDPRLRREVALKVLHAAALGKIQNGKAVSCRKRDLEAR